MEQDAEENLRPEIYALHKLRHFRIGEWKCRVVFYQRGFNAPRRVPNDPAVVLAVAEEGSKPFEFLRGSTRADTARTPELAEVFRFHSIELE